MQEGDDWVWRPFNNGTGTGEWTWNGESWVWKSSRPTENGEGNGEWVWNGTSWEWSTSTDNGNGDSDNNGDTNNNGNSDNNGDSNRGGGAVNCGVQRELEEGEEEVTYKLEIRIGNKEWDEDLEDTNSALYKEYEGILNDQVRQQRSR